MVTDGDAGRRQARAARGDLGPVRHLPSPGTADRRCLQPDPRLEVRVHPCIGGGGGGRAGRTWPSSSPATTTPSPSTARPCPCRVTRTSSSRRWQPSTRAPSWCSTPAAPCSCLGSTRWQGVVEDWYPGEEDGDAIAAVLYGDVDPSGHLPVTFPVSAAQSAINTPEQWPGVDLVSTYSEGLDVGYRYNHATGVRPLFAFGDGLSYTRFTLSDLSVHRSHGSDLVSVRVANVGRRTGTAVPQAYLTDPPAAGEPPAQLAAFARVTLRAGASRRMTMTVPLSAFEAYLGGPVDGGARHLHRVRRPVVGVVAAERAGTCAGDVTAPSEADASTWKGSGHASGTIDDRHPGAVTRSPSAASAPSLAASGRPSQGAVMTSDRSRPAFKVADLSLADFGRHEIELAEHEMPGPHGHARRARLRAAVARRPHHRVAAHDGADGSAHRDPHRPRRRGALGQLQHLLHPGPRGGGRGRRAHGHARGAGRRARLRLEGRDPRGVLVVHPAGPRLARARPDHDPRRWRRRHPARPQGGRSSRRQDAYPTRRQPTPRSSPWSWRCWPRA